MSLRFQLHLLIFSVFLGIFLFGAYFYSEHLLASPSITLDGISCQLGTEIKDVNSENSKDCFQFKTDVWPTGVIEKVFLQLAFDISEGTLEKISEITETPEIPIEKIQEENREEVLKQEILKEESAPAAGVENLLNLKLGIKILLAQIAETIGEIFQKDSFDIKNNAVLEISYRLSNLNDWKTIGYIDATKSANIKIALLIDPQLNWSDIENLQIGLKKINLSNKFKLNSIRLEIEYAPPSDILSETTEIMEKQEIIETEEMTESVEVAEVPNDLALELAKENDLNEDKITETTIKIDDTKDAKIDLSSLVDFKLSDGSGELELYALPDRCLGSLDEIKRNLLTYPYCGDPIGFPISRPDAYSWKMGEDARIVIGACSSKEIDCGDEPEKFIIYFISEEKLRADEENSSIILKSVQSVI